MKPHFAGILSMLVTVSGTILALVPVVQGHVPPQYAWIIVALGIICQSITKPVHAGGTDLVPKASTTPSLGES